MAAHTAGNGNAASETQHITNEEAQLILGNSGNTMTKLSVLSGAQLHLSKVKGGKGLSELAISGTVKQRELAWKYIEFVIAEKLGSINVDDDSAHLDDDVTMVMVPRSSIGTIVGEKGASLRKIAEVTYTFCFFQGGIEGEAPQKPLLIFGRPDDRKRAEAAVWEKSRQRFGKFDEPRMDEKSSAGRGGRRDNTSRRQVSNHADRSNVEEAAEEQRRRQIRSASTPARMDVELAERMDRAARFIQHFWKFRRPPDGLSRPRRAPESHPDRPSGRGAGGGRNMSGREGGYPSGNRLPGRGGKGKARRDEPDPWRTWGKTTSGTSACGDDRANMEVNEGDGDASTGISLCNVIGVWRDQSGSTYSVAADGLVGMRLESCTVTIRRRDGEFRRGRIQINPEGQVGWGPSSQYIVDSATLTMVRWVPTKPGRDFVWHRLEGGEEEAELAAATRVGAPVPCPPPRNREPEDPRFRSHAPRERRRGAPPHFCIFQGDIQGLSGWKLENGSSHNRWDVLIETLRECLMMDGEWPREVEASLFAGGDAIHINGAVQRLAMPVVGTKPDGRPMCSPATAPAWLEMLWENYGADQPGLRWEISGMSRDRRTSQQALLKRLDKVLESVDQSSDAVAIALDCKEVDAVYDDLTMEGIKAQRNESTQVFLLLGGANGFDGQDDEDDTFFRAILSRFAAKLGEHRVARVKMSDGPSKLTSAKTAGFILTEWVRGMLLRAVAAIEARSTRGGVAAARIGAGAASRPSKPSALPREASRRKLGADTTEDHALPQQAESVQPQHAERVRPRANGYTARNAEGSFDNDWPELLGKPQAPGVRGPRVAGSPAPERARWERADHQSEDSRAWASMAGQLRKGGSGGPPAEGGGGRWARRRAAA